MVWSAISTQNFTLTFFFPKKGTVENGREAKKKQVTFGSTRLTLTLLSRPLGVLGPPVTEVSVSLGPYHSATTTTTTTTTTYYYYYYYYYYSAIGNGKDPSGPRGTPSCQQHHGAGAATARALADSSSKFVHDLISLDNCNGNELPLAVQQHEIKGHHILLDDEWSSYCLGKVRKIVQKRDQNS